jgi:hypothetical protein
MQIGLMVIEDQMGVVFGHALISFYKIWVEFSYLSP